MIKVTGFDPDADPTTPGVVVDCYNMAPTTRGMAAIGRTSIVLSDTLSDPCLGSQTVTQLDGSFRTFAGTVDAIYEVSSAAWNDVSKVGGYSTGTGERWRFAQFGSATIATNYSDAVQVSTSGGFSDLSGTPPKARIVTTNGDFVLLFDYNDGVDSYSDGWWCSGLFDHTTWTPSAATQAANGRLLKTPGNIVGAKPLGSFVVVYKDNSMYVGQYVGPPVIWQWDLIASSVGAFSHEAIVEVHDVHYFLGRDGIFMFDGSRPVPVAPLSIRNWLSKEINLEYAHLCIGGYDPKESLIYWFYPSVNSSGSLDRAIIYNTVTGSFGRYFGSAQAAINYSTPNLTWAEYEALAANWLALGSAVDPWLSPVLFGSNVGLSFVLANGTIAVIDKVSARASSNITTNDFGDDTYYSTIQQVRARFLKKPSSSSLTHFSKVTSGDSYNNRGAVAINDSKFDLLWSDRWHRFVIAFNGTAEISGLDFRFARDGER